MLGLLMLFQVHGFAVEPKLAVNWQQFLSRHDLVWNSVPSTWDDAAFLGNGLMGAAIYNGEKDCMVWDVGRSDVADNRPNEINPLFAKARMPIGRLILQPVGHIIGGATRLDLWNAEARGTVRTDRGEIRWRSFVHAAKMVLVVELETSEGERACKWQWRPDLAINSRKVYRKFSIGEEDLNPAPWIEESGDARISIQRLQSGVEYSTAWLERQNGPDQRTIFLSVGYSTEGTAARTEALQQITEASKTGLISLVQSHRDWWHAYYPSSFLSIPDTKLESFYWIQIYKLACVTRADRSIIDNMGPWFLPPTPHPGVWWNMDVEVDYLPVYTANRLELGESLTRTLDRNLSNLILNVPPQYRHDSAGIGVSSGFDARVDVDPDPTTTYSASKAEVSTASAPRKFRVLGNLVWLCHNYWLQYRYSMDQQMLRDRLFPLLKRAVNFYLHQLETAPDGKLHMPEAWSSEYPALTTDNNLDLALLRWGCQTLLEAAETLRVDDPLIPRWREVLANLTPYPIDETGLMIGRGVPLEVSHRHWSHLVAIYPLRIMNSEQPDMRELIERSFDHWTGLRERWGGYSEATASAMASSLGRGDEAQKFLENLVKHYALPNTMHREASPLLHASLMATTAIHEMLLQSWNGIIRVFPAVPSAWQEASFHHLRTEGAFLVSAMRQNGQTQFVTVTSLAGEPCRLKLDMFSGFQVQAEREILKRMLPEGVVEVDLRKGETITFYATGNSRPTCEVVPVAGSRADENYFGGAAMADRVIVPYWGESQARIRSRPGEAESSIIRDSRMQWEPGPQRPK